MTRWELITSDEYLGVANECIIKSGRSTSEMRKEMIEFMIKYRNELLEALSQYRQSPQTAGAVEALEILYEAVPKQTNDADWWPDELTEAMQKAKKVLFESSGDKDSEREVPATQTQVEYYENEIERLKAKLEETEGYMRMYKKLHEAHNGY